MLTKALANKASCKGLEGHMIVPMTGPHVEDIGNGRHSAVLRLRVSTLR